MPAAAQHALHLMVHRAFSSGEVLSLSSKTEGNFYAPCLDLELLGDLAGPCPPLAVEHSRSLLGFAALQEPQPPNDDQVDGRQLMSAYLDSVHLKEADTVHCRVKELRAASANVRGGRPC